MKFLLSFLLLITITSCDISSTAKNESTAANDSDQTDISNISAPPASNGNGQSSANNNSNCTGTTQDGNGIGLNPIYNFQINLSGGLPGFLAPIAIAWRKKP